MILGRGRCSAGSLALTIFQSPRIFSVAVWLPTLTCMTRVGRPARDAVVLADALAAGSPASVSATALPASSRLMLDMDSPNWGPLPRPRSPERHRPGSDASIDEERIARPG